MKRIGGGTVSSFSFLTFGLCKSFKTVFNRLKSVKRWFENKSFLFSLFLLFISSEVWCKLGKEVGTKKMAFPRKSLWKQIKKENLGKWKKKKREKRIKEKEEEREGKGREKEKRKKKKENNKRLGNKE